MRAIKDFTQADLEWFSRGINRKNPWFFNEGIHFYSFLQIIVNCAIETGSALCHSLHLQPEALAISELEASKLSFSGMIKLHRDQAFKQWMLHPCSRRLVDGILDYRIEIAVAARHSRRKPHGMRS